MRIIYLFPESFILFQVEKLNRKLKTFLSNSTVTLYLIKQESLVQLIKEPDSIYLQKDKEYQIYTYLTLILSKLLNLCFPSTKLIEYHQNIYIQQCLVYIHIHYQ